MSERVAHPKNGFEPSGGEEVNREQQKVPKGIFAFDGYLFDLDGTVYAGNQLLPGVLSTIDKLRESGKSILFVTNTTTHTREGVHERLSQLGIACSQEDILTALCVSRMYFQEYLPEAKVLMIGEQAMRNEMEQHGVETTNDPLSATHVLVGLDRQFTYEKLTLGMSALRNGAQLIAANPDPFCPLEDGAIPDTWSLVKALETASSQSVYKVIGKPSEYYAKKALEKLAFAPEACLMVGDRVSTDICFGNANGMYTALVLTGADSRKDIMLQGIKPDYVLASLSEIK
ncbi:acid sugar phosphatase [Paenibacillus marchantiophytorum]|uniref:Acid sugar phosphatase n=1 Tax=Paenibacillus marchantiophytorum TaxID=1619310 RepID=A0ABQ1F254_9BACL|nr:HAD-IIA family hydrolase [Paenibacillus marchantiophytorum]GFZ96242.1 acid sugar phosphatase [Paenibacillus marchantiophytorum]